MGVARVGRGGSKAAQVTTETVTTGTGERNELAETARWSVVEVRAVRLARAERGGCAIWVFYVTD